jgi:phospholipid/cholesterol/gamma-HCH transport system substrate-binding protein
VKLETRVGLFILIAIGTFLYLSINIRAIRLDKNQYYTYKAYFDDTGGLTIKSPVKIAGVDVGWVENIELLDSGKAEIVMRLSKYNKLAKNAYARVIQEGLIGTKSLEIDPGDSSTGLLLPGSALSMPGKTPANVGELLDQFRDIATTVQDIASSFKNVFATRQGEDNMRLALNSIAKASDRIADFSTILQRTLHANEENINVMIGDFRATAEYLKEGVPSITNNVRDVSLNIQNNANKLTSDIGATTKTVGSAFEQVEDTAIQARDTFKEASQVMEKINTGKGVIGKLINEDETYSDLKRTIRGLKDYIGRTQALMLNIDMHSETMLRNPNAKGYFELKLRPNSDCFYMLQLVSDEKGSISRDVTTYTRKDINGTVLVPSQLDIPIERKVEFAETVERVVQKKNDILFGLQFGKRFDRLVFRIGLFENTFGVGCDYYVPLKTNWVHWVTSLEAFDFAGVNRLNDTRPHVKWINKAFFLKNLYTTFGVDDIYSKKSANPFLGGGIRFSDDDLKYFISYLPLRK